jgi:hypothetical protein
MGLRRRFAVLHRGKVGQFGRSLRYAVSPFNVSTSSSICRQNSRPSLCHWCHEAFNEVSPAGAPFAAASEIRFTYKGIDRLLPFAAISASVATLAKPGSSANDRKALRMCCCCSGFRKSMRFEAQRKRKPG